MAGVSPGRSRQRAEERTLFKHLSDFRGRKLESVGKGTVELGSGDDKPEAARGGRGAVGGLAGLNPDHPLVEELKARYDQDASDPLLGDYADIASCLIARRTQAERPSYSSRTYDLRIKVRCSTN